MTLSTIVAPVSTVGDDAETEFTFPYLFNANADLKVYLRDNTTLIYTLQTITTEYTVTGAGTGSGTVTFVTPPTSGQTVWIYRDTQQTQGTDLTSGGKLPAETLEDSLDKLTMLVQDHIGRGFVSRQYFEQTAAQSLTPGGADTNTSLSAIDLPDVSADATDDTYKLYFVVQVAGMSVAELQVAVFNGTNGNATDGAGKVILRVYDERDTAAGDRTVSGTLVFTPAVSTDKKIGLAVNVASGSCNVQGVAPRISTILIEKIR